MLLRPVVLAVSAALSLSLAPQLAASAETSQNPCRLPAGVLTPSDLPDGSSATTCRAVGREVRLGSTNLVVPPPGRGVGVEEMTPRGARSAVVSTSPAGRVAYDLHGDGSPSVAGGDDPDGTLRMAPAPGACARERYKPTGAKWKDQPYTFRIGDGNFPAGGTRADYADAAVRAARNIVQSQNTCDLADEVDATFEYAGYTSLESDFATSGDRVCKENPDGTSVIDAGGLRGSEAIATACWWFSYEDGPERLSEVDIRVDIAQFQFTYRPGADSCRARYDVEALLTHEIGHAFGLADLYQSDDRNLTMYGSLYYCDAKARTLGKGDVLGLRALY